MANLKSAKKRAKVADVRRARNFSAKSSVKTAIKGFEQAVNAADKEKASNAMQIAIKKIDQAGSKGLYHKKNVANKKSRIMRAFNKMA